MVYLTSMKCIILPLRIHCNTKVKYSNSKLYRLIFATIVSFELFTNLHKHIFYKLLRIFLVLKFYNILLKEMGMSKKLKLILLLNEFLMFIV